MDIVACTDNGFVMPTGIMMISVCVNNQDEEIVFHIVIDEVSPNNKKKLEDAISEFQGKSVVFYETKKIDTSAIPQKEDWHRLPLTTYYRLYLGMLLPSTIKKIIYIDGDMIVRRSLMPLWNLDMEGKAIAAASDTDFFCEEYFKRLEYPKDMGYFNAGILVINLEYWRNKNLLSPFIDFMIQHKDKIKNYDQDVLNYVLRDCKINLPIKYNLQSGFLSTEKSFGPYYRTEIKAAIADPAVLHYTGGSKPWHCSCRHPYRSSFLKYKALSPWKDEPLIEDRPMSIRIKKAFGMILRKCRLIPELPPYGKGFLPGLKPID